MQTNNKLREALVKISDMIMGGGFDGRSPAHIVNICDAALAAPPRNCDMFSTVDEVHKAWDDYLEKHPELPPSCKTYGAIIPWLFAPATARKGETDGK